LEAPITKTEKKTKYNTIQVQTTEKCSKNQGGGGIHYTFPDNVYFLGRAMALKVAYTAYFLGNFVSLQFGEIHFSPLG
jgi:hypothetical protein